MALSVIVLGAGGMGSVAAIAAAKLEQVSRLTIADIDIDRAGHVASQCGSIATAYKVDVTNPVELSAALMGHDIVLNSTGPFYELGTIVLDHAIAAGVHYADICDDWEPTLDLLDKHELAKNAGIVAIIGMGASPGITSMLAVLVSRELDEIDDLITGWSIEGDDDSNDFVPPGEAPSAATIHWLQQLTGTIRQLEGGSLGDHQPLQRRVIHYPDYGELPVWTVGHPEAVTLPRTFSNLSGCSNVMVGDDNVFGALKQLAASVDDGSMTIREAAAMVGESIAGVDSSDGPEQPNNKPSIFAWACGKSGGRAKVVGAQLTAAPPGGMGGVTGVPLALAIPAIATAIGKKAGVFAAESIVEPTSFLTSLASHCGDGGRGVKHVYYMSSEYLDG